MHCNLEQDNANYVQSSQVVNCARAFYCTTEHRSVGSLTFMVLPCPPHPPPAKLKLPEKSRKLRTGGYSSDTLEYFWRYACSLLQYCTFEILLVAKRQLNISRCRPGGQKTFGKIQTAASCCFFRYNCNHSSYSRESVSRRHSSAEHLSSSVQLCQSGCC